MSELGELDESVDLGRLDEGDGIVATLINHRAKWHKLCRMKYNNMKLQRVKRKLSEEPGSSAATPPKRTRSIVSSCNARSTDNWTRSRLDWFSPPLFSV